MCLIAYFNWLNNLKEDWIILKCFVVRRKKSLAKEIISMIFFSITASLLIRHDDLPPSKALGRV